jgi:hypothetical protein
MARALQKDAAEAQAVGYRLLQGRHEGPAGVIEWCWWELQNP